MFIKGEPMKKYIFILFFSISFAQIRDAKKDEIKTTDNTHGEMSTLWFQVSGEARASFYQAYHLATVRLDEYLTAPRKTRSPAVVTDVDETVLDNSPYQAWTILKKQSYPAGWTEWVNKAEAAPLPGALEFFQYAASKGVEVFYVTNRTLTERTGTVENLKKMKFPFADTNHVLVRTAESSKQSRRNAISDNFDIVLLCGDNLNDLAEFSKLSNDSRNAKVEEMKDEFGSRFIVLPNPMYGDWEGAAYGYNYGISDSAKAAKRKAALKGF